jgi:hypothetical protein
MGMTASLYSVSEQQVEDLRSDPAQSWKLLEAGDAAVDLDKAWHGIHYLLTGTAWEGEDDPLGFLLYGGEPLGDEEEEDAVPRLFGTAEVRQVDAALSTLDAGQLRQRYDPQAMQELDIYPAIWGEGEEALAYCLQHFDMLKDFVAQTVRQGRGMMLFIG